MIFSLCFLNKYIYIYYIGPRSRKQAFFKKSSKHGRGLIFAKRTCACGRACLCAAARTGVRVCERGMRASVRAWLCLI